MLRKKKSHNCFVGLAEMLKQRHRVYTFGEIRVAYLLAVFAY